MALTVRNSTAANVVVFSVACSMLAAGCDARDRIDSRAAAIEIGAGKAAVIAILGPAAKTESGNVLGIERETLVWESRGIRCQASFVLERVVAKSCTSPR